jgi:hypothetical protein
MKHRYFEYLAGAAVCLALASFLIGCNEAKPNPKAEAPPASTVVPDLDAKNF